MKLIMRRVQVKLIKTRVQANSYAFLLIINFLCSPLAYISLVSEARPTSINRCRPWAKPPIKKKDIFFQKCSISMWYWYFVFDKKIYIFSNFFSKVFKFTWKMRNRLNREKNQISDFSDFYFSSYREKFIENWGDDVTKITITRKRKIGNIWNLIFLSIQPIADLSC